jgi:hypothetical protein
VTDLTGTSHDLDPALFGGVAEAIIEFRAKRPDTDEDRYSLQGHRITVVLDAGLLLEGDMTDGNDKLLLEGDMQDDGDDVLLTEGV